MTTPTKHHFVLEVTDRTTQSISSETSLEVTDVSELCTVLDLDADDLAGGAIYDLEPSDVGRLTEFYGIQFNPPMGAAVALRAWHPLDQLSYKIHTGRELAMMLAQQKPLAVFCDAYPSVATFEVIPERAFEPHVAAGRIIKREAIFHSAPRSSGGRSRDSRFVLYSLPDQKWRIDAYLLLHTISLKSGWNEGFERMQGTLLGYEEWQNDVFIEMMYRPGVVANQKARLKS
jgi:hypothetical protein